MVVTTQAIEGQDGPVYQAVPSGLVDGAWEGQECPSCGLPRISYGGRTSFLGIPYSVWHCTACEKRYRLWVTTLEDLRAAYAAAGLNSLAPADEDGQPAGNLTRAEVAAERIAWAERTPAPAPYPSLPYPPTATDCWALALRYGKAVDEGAKGVPSPYPGPAEALYAAIRGLYAALAAAQKEAGIELERATYYRQEWQKLAQAVAGKLASSDA